MLSHGFAITILIIVVILLIGLLLTYLIQASISSLASTPKKIIDEILSKMEISKDTIFADLGAGIGNIVFTASTKYQNKNIALELSPILGYVMLLRKIKHRIINGEKHDIEIIVDNFTTQDLSKIDVMYLNLPKKIVNTFERRIDKILDQGKTIFVYQNSFNNHTPSEVFVLSNSTKLYKYELTSKKLKEDKIEIKGSN